MCLSMASGLTASLTIRLQRQKVPMIEGRVTVELLAWFENRDILATVESIHPSTGRSSA
jgi:hypothetical protein